MSLESLIQSRINLTAEEIQAELNAKTVRKTNSVRFTWTGLLEKFGEEACNSINEKIGDGPVSKALSGIGIDFSLDKTQDGLEAKRSFLGDTVVDSLKSLGVYYITPYQQEGYVGEVTLEEVISVRQSILDREQKDSLQRKLATVINEVLQPLITQGKSWDELKSAFAEIE